MIKVALTGGVSTGKTTALEIFKDLGCATISSSPIVKELMIRDDVLKSRLKTTFNCIKKDGSIDREKLGKVVFSNDNARQKLEDLTHPLVKIVRKEFFQRCEQNNVKIAVCETPLFFEKELSSEFDCSVLLLVSLDLRIDRFIESGRGSQEDFFQITKNQMLDNEKNVKADFFIKNNSSKEKLREKIQQVIIDIEKKF